MSIYPSSCIAHYYIRSTDLMSFCTKIAKKLNLTFSGYYTHSIVGRQVGRIDRHTHFDCSWRNLKRKHVNILKEYINFRTYNDCYSCEVYCFWKYNITFDVFYRLCDRYLDVSARLVQRKCGQVLYIDRDTFKYLSLIPYKLLDTFVNKLL